MDLYIVLGLPHGATESDIKRAYRRLARRFHPDINPGDQTAEARFRQILEAYETLIDPSRRSRYDAGHRRRGRAWASGRSGFEGFDFSTRGADYSATFGDLFAEVLTERGGRARRARAWRRSALRDAQLTFEEAFAGRQRAITVTRRETCRTLRRHRADARDARAPVTSVRHRRGALGARAHGVLASCSACGGTVSSGRGPASRAAGSGQETRTETRHRADSAGRRRRRRVRVAGKGQRGAARRRLPAISTSPSTSPPHPVFRRDGDDLHMVVPIAVHEAALGATIEFARSTAARGCACRRARSRASDSVCASAARHRRATGRRGDLIVEVRMMLPKLLDERSKELLREFGRDQRRERPARRMRGWSDGQAC